METAVINGKTYTKEEIIQIGKEHFEAAKRLRKYGIFIAGLSLGFCIISLVFFLMIINDAIEFPDYKTTVTLFNLSILALTIFGVFFLIGALVTLLSYTKSNEQEYIKAGVVYLNNHPNE